VNVERLLLGLDPGKGRATPAPSCARPPFTPQNLQFRRSKTPLRKGRQPRTSAPRRTLLTRLKEICPRRTQAAARRQADPVIGRDEEIPTHHPGVVRADTKNNPVLIGQPGVGKDRIVEGLRLRIVNGDVPEAPEGQEAAVA